MRVRSGRIGAITVLVLILGVTFFSGLFLWVLIKPDFGLAYNIYDPTHPFSFKKPDGTQVPSVKEPELNFNETLAMLRDNGCALIEGKPENLNPDKCVYLSQKEFIEEALRRKLVFLHIDETASRLYVPEGDGHVAWWELREPA